MAIALRGSAVIPTGGQQNPTTGYTCTIPSQVVAGDLLFLTLTSRDSTGAGTIAVADNGEAGGWTNFGHSSTDYKLTLWWKQATASSASATLTVSGCVGSCSGVLKAFSGAWAGAASPVMDVVFETNTSTDKTHSGFTPSTNDGMVCCAVADYANDDTASSLSFATLGATTSTECLSTGGSDCGNIFGHKLQSGAPAATGNLTWTQANNTTYSAVWTIRPVAPAIVTTSLNATASGGALGSAHTQALSGQEATSARGNVTATHVNIGVLVGLSGSTANGALTGSSPTPAFSGPRQYLLAPNLYLNDKTNSSYAVLGAYVTGNGAASGSSVALTGLAFVCVLGNSPTPATHVDTNLVGQQLVSDQGALAAGGATVSSLVGLEAGSVQGALAVSTNPALTSIATVVVSGTVDTRRTCLAAGQQMASGQGTLTHGGVDIALIGKSAEVGRGSFFFPTETREYLLAPGIYLNDHNNYSYVIAGIYVSGIGAAAATPVSVALTGLEANAIRGVLFPTDQVESSSNGAAAFAGIASPGLMVALAGQAASTARGELFPASAGNAMLPGQVATVSRGTITSSFSVPIEEAHEAEVPGLQATTVQGALSVLVSRAFVGQVATVSRGAFISAQTQAIAGQEITASVGTVTGQHVNTGTLIGLGASCAGGEIATAHANALTGQAGIAQQGDVTASHVNTAALVGQQATAQADSVATQHTNALAGLEAAAESGAPSAGSAGSSTLNGLEASGEVGALRPDHRNTIAGLQAATERGELAAISSVAPTLTGLQTAAELGTAGVRHVNALIGAETSTAEGSITAGPAGLLSGQQLTTQADLVGVIHSNTLTGVEAVGTQGALSAGSAGASMLNGLQAASALGVLQPDYASALTGLEASTARGELTAVATTGVTLTGQAATSAQGALGTQHSNALAGQVGTTQQGTIGASYPVSVAATGQQATVTAGQETATVVVSLQGHSLTLVQGSLSQAAAVALAGRGAAVSEGVLAVHSEGEEALGGVEAVAEQGELFPELEVSLEENEVELVGLEATVQQGQLRAFGGTLLFVDPKFRNTVNGRQWCNTDDGREWSNAA